ncbi:NAD-dependent epimerase/dehydratase family protein [Rossellomorea aquimaris]|uniref:NAD-dependent epimerase/dehydratase family protein n=1 Tax=Rossellomorea aquimaris TaxID=189382 RepID=UPI000DEBD314|nr:NAD-dependent epimerase/dehydratase family protein [Rossellomorea aquimaris]
MKIVITGGAGFIGMHLTKRLLKVGHQVSIIDCFHTYYSAHRKKQHVSEIKFPTGDLYEVDLLDRDKTRAIINELKPDAVIHLAALPGVAYSLEEPLKYVDYDIKATINMVEACGEAGVKHFLFASSSSVYGDKPGMPLKEEDADGMTISPYAASKWSAESFCHMYAHMYDMHVNILRFFTVYDPWGRPDMAIPKFISKLLKNESISIFGSDSGRDYTYIDDIIHGIELTLHKGKRGETYNLGSGRVVKMTRLLEILRHHFPEMNVNYDTYRLGDVFSTHSDISKAQSHLGYSPITTIEEGIGNTILWAKQNEKHL